MNIVRCSFCGNKGVECVPSSNRRDVFICEECVLLIVKVFENEKPQPVEG